MADRPEDLRCPVWGCRKAGARWVVLHEHWRLAVCDVHADDVETDSAGVAAGRGPRRRAEDRPDGRGGPGRMGKRRGEGGRTAMINPKAESEHAVTFEVTIRAFGHRDRAVLESAQALAVALHRIDPSDRWEMSVGGQRVRFDALAYDGEHAGHDSALSIEGAVGAVDAAPEREEADRTIGGSFHQHVLRHSHGGGDADHNHVQMAAEACDQSASVTAPRQFWEGIAPLLMLGYERLDPGDVAEGRFDRAVLAACLAEAVSAVDAAARRLRAVWRNVGGDAGNVEAEAER